MNTVWKKHFLNQHLKLIFLLLLFTNCNPVATEDEKIPPPIQPEILTIFPEIEKWMDESPQIVDSLKYQNNDRYLQYQAYGLIQQAVATYQIDQHLVQIRIFEMKDTKNAFAIWSNLKYEGCEIDTLGGKQCFVGAYSLDFWQDRFYIHIQRYRQSEQTRKIMYQLAAAIQDKLMKNKENFIHLDDTKHEN